jgi:nucleotide-binding universal stress UspA family protein
MLRTMFDRVVVPLDLGPPADRALPVAQAVVRKLGGRLDAVIVRAGESTPGSMSTRHAGMLGRWDVSSTAWS